MGVSQLLEQVTMEGFWLPKRFTLKLLKCYILVECIYEMVDLLLFYIQEKDKGILFGLNFKSLLILLRASC